MSFTKLLLSCLWPWKGPVISVRQIVFKKLYTVLYYTRKSYVVKHNLISEVYLMTVMETTTCFGLYLPSSGCLGNLRANYMHACARGVEISTYAWLDKLNQNRGQIKHYETEQIVIQNTWIQTRQKRYFFGGGGLLEPSKFFPLRKRTAFRKKRSCFGKGHKKAPKEKKNE